MLSTLIKLADHLDRNGHYEESDMLDSIIEKMAAKNKKTKGETRGDCVFQSTHPKVKDGKDHFPINSEAQARNALARVNQFEEAPPWYDGSLKSLVSSVAKAVENKYKDIEVSKSAKKPGKG